MRTRFVLVLSLFNIALLSACGSGSVASSNTTPGTPSPGSGTGTATLTWPGPTTNADAPPTPLTDLAGYHVYMSTTTGSYGSTPTTTVTANSATGGGTISTTLTNLAPGTHYFIVRAYDSSGNESANSPERSKTIP
jgi:hypothetical protein